MKPDEIPADVRARARRVFGHQSRGVLETEAIARAIFEAEQRGRKAALEEGVPASLLEAWRLHEALCDIWGDDDLSSEEQEEAFRAYLRSEGWDDAETISPDVAGEYSQALVISGLRDFIRAKIDEVQP